MPVVISCFVVICKVSRDLSASAENDLGNTRAKVVVVFEEGCSRSAAVQPISVEMISEFTSVIYLVFKLP